jgi:hypothetical protein
MACNPMNRVQNTDRSFAGKYLDIGFGLMMRDKVVFKAI